MRLRFLIAVALAALPAPVMAQSNAGGNAAGAGTAGGGFYARTYSPPAGSSTVQGQVPPGATATCKKNGSATGTASVTAQGAVTCSMGSAAAAGDLFSMPWTLTGETPTVGTGGAVVAPPNAGLAMSQLTAMRVYQRTSKSGGGAGKGEGPIPLSITLQSSASSIECRVRDALASGNPVVKNWTTAATSVPSSTTTVTCPAVPADARQYFVDSRANGDDAQVVLGNAPVMMGRIVGFSGQSQMARMLVPGSGETISSLGVAVSPYSAVYGVGLGDGSTNDGAGLPAKWAASTDATYGSTYHAEFLRRQVGFYGVATAWVGYSQGSTKISRWAPGTADNIALRQVLDMAGGFEDFYWYQGGDDAGAGTAKADYKTSLTGMFADITAHNAAWGGNYRKLLTAMATRLSGGAGTTAQVTAIRQAHKEWAADNGGIYLEPHDVNLVDNVHQGQPGSIILAQHAHRALTTGDKGPTLGTPSRASGSAVISIPVNLPAGATTLVLTGNAYTRLAVYPTGQTTGALTTTALSYDSTAKVLSLTLSAAPADSQALDVYAFGHPDPSGSSAFADMIRDDRVDGDGVTVGRSLEPSTSGPIVVPAVTGSGGGTTPPPSGGPAVGDVVLVKTYHSGSSNPGTIPGWNLLDQRLYSDVTANSMALTNQNGGATGLTAQVINGNITGGNDGGATTGNNSGVFPDAVMKSSLYADKTNAVGAGTSSLIDVKVSGFVSGTMWKVESLTNRAVSSRLVNLGATGQAVQAIDSGNNTTKLATFNGVAPSNGVIDVTATQNGSENYCYLNGFRLTRTN